MQGATCVIRDTSASDSSEGEDDAGAGARDRPLEEIISPPDARGNPEMADLACAQSSGEFETMPPAASPGSMARGDLAVGAMALLLLAATKASAASIDKAWTGHGISNGEVVFTDIFYTST